MILVSGVQYNDSVSLVTVHHHTVANIFFLVVRTFKIYFLSNFQICNTVLLTMVTTLYITSS